MMKRIWNSIGLWLNALLGQPVLHRCCRVADAPDKLERGIVYVVGANGYDWSALMRCPGRCGKTLEMNLLRTAKPVWKVTSHADDTVSLHPSVWLKTGCRCHFVLQRGHIRWV